MPSSDPPASTVPLDHDAAIGRLARTWGHLEHVVELTLWELADVHHQFGACITAQMGSIHPKLKAVAALARLRGGDAKLLKAIEAFQRPLYEIGEARARAVHDPRFRRELDGEIYRWQTTATPKEVVFGPQLETVATLDTITQRIRKRIHEFTALRQRIQNELLTPGRRPPVTLQRIIDSQFE